MARELKVVFLLSTKDSADYAGVPAVIRMLEEEKCPDMVFDNLLTATGLRKLFKEALTFDRPSDRALFEIEYMTGRSLNQLPCDETKSAGCTLALAVRLLRGGREPETSWYATAEVGPDGRLCENYRATLKGKLIALALNSLSSDESVVILSRSTWAELPTCLPPEWIDSSCTAGHADCHRVTIRPPRKPLAVRTVHLLYADDLEAAETLISGKERAQRSVDSTISPRPKRLLKKGPLVGIFAVSVLVFLALLSLENRWSHDDEIDIQGTQSGVHFVRSRFSQRVLVRPSRPRADRRTLMVVNQNKVRAMLTFRQGTITEKLLLGPGQSRRVELRRATAEVMIAYDEGCGNPKPFKIEFNATHYKVPQSPHCD